MTETYRETAIQTIDQQGQPQQAKPAGLNIPIDQIKGLAKYWPMVKNFAPMLGFKVPKEIDTLLTMINSGGEPTPEQISQMQGMIDGQGQVPERRIGEPVLTPDLAQLAYRMHKEGWSMRDIAEDFTKNGNPAAASTVCEWINRYEEDMDIEGQERRAKRKALVLKSAVIGALWIVSLVVAKFLLHF